MSSERTVATNDLYGGFDPILDEIVVWSSNYDVSYHFELCETCRCWRGYAIGPLSFWWIRFRDCCDWSSCDEGDEIVDVLTHAFAMVPEKA